MIATFSRASTYMYTYTHTPYTPLTYTHTPYTPPTYTHTPYTGVYSSGRKLVDVLQWFAMYNGLTQV